MHKMITAGVAAVLFSSATGSLQAFDDRVSVGVLAGTTGAGAEVSWRFHERLGVTAQYAGGLSWDGDFDTDDVDYDGDLDISAGAIKFDYYPFAGRFYLTAGAMLPDMEANVSGRSKRNDTFEFNGATYQASDIGSLHGKLTIADGVQPYLGLGWRSSHRQGFGLFSELGVMATSIDVSLGTSENYEGEHDQFRRDLRREEQRLKDEADKLPFYPVAVVGISYTF
ncbi:hypothetical protein [Halomonas sp. BC04]|uniref:hypothetical protein n=1 Tax=Halomonas sp. BC04 TaxID=1403540 RepID=UPI0003ED73F8|nr:hypothetical protein [Halomonas sp. BC04]EWH02988.1 hypothetical protein Q427_05780 [Halomonas sp. BC04]